MLFAMSTESMDRLTAALADRYRVERKLGEGGMATVYLAQDLKHERQVALKVLKPEISVVLGAERFLSEIRTTANLQHPNILPLFDSGEADGQLFYVMPYIEGESLRELLDRERQLPIEEAVALLSDVAEALQVAHEAGVIHRDIKPANIMLRAGKPVVADFGIALAVSAAGEGRMTETGLSLGTPYYMSPEQASADRDPTPASDVYSLGCVAYEILTGEPPFPGGSAQAVLAKILTGDAARPTELRKSIPPHVEAAVMKAIERLPADRFTSPREFERALRDPSFRWGRAAEAVAPAAAGRWRAAALVLAVASVAFLTGLFAGGRDSSSGTVFKQRISLSKDLEAGFVRYGLAISPDGSTLVFADSAAGNLMVKHRDRLDPISLAGAELDSHWIGSAPVFSPDGEWIAYFGASTLNKIPVGGGTPIELTDSVSNTNREVAWLDDGSLVYNGPGWTLKRVSAEGGPSETLYESSSNYVVGLTGLPNGRGVLFNSCDNGCPNPALWVFDSEKREAKELIPEAVRGYYAAGSLLYVSGAGALFATPFDLGDLDIQGSSVSLMSGIRVRAQHADLKLGASGSLLYATGDAIAVEGGYHLVWADRSGSVEVIDGSWGGEMTVVALSPDDRHVVVDLDQELWVRDLRDRTVTRLATSPVLDQRPQWSADGREVYYFDTTGVEDGRRALHRRRADGSDESQIYLQLGPTAFEELAWSKNGEVAIARLGDRLAATPENSFRLIRHPSDSVPKQLFEADYRFWAPTLSPDGRWVAYVSVESGEPEVYVRPVPDVTSARYTISIGGGLEPLWSPTGDEIFFRSGPSSSVFRAARVRTSPTFEVVSRDSLFALRSLRTSVAHRAYDVTQDGQRFLLMRSQNALIREESQDEERSLVLVENWFEELRAILESR
jgi:serine/threonine-protein kinase